MIQREIINKVKAIILTHAKPKRIYIYGSQISGESEKTSDIDIAFDDEEFKDIGIIEDEIKQLNTLVKIDVKNIAFCDDRFKNRVKDTGRVIYSANKKLRFEDSLINFSNAYNKFENIVNREQEFKKEGFGDIYLDVVVKRFEFTFEMVWKTIKRYLDFVGIRCVNPRDCLKEAFSQGIIKNEHIWLDMIEQRNLSSHIYDEAELKDILYKMQDYKKSFYDLKLKLVSYNIEK